MCEMCEERKDMLYGNLVQRYTPRFVEVAESGAVVPAKLSPGTQKMLEKAWAKILLNSAY